MPSAHKFCRLERQLIRAHFAHLDGDTPGTHLIFQSSRPTKNNADRVVVYRIWSTPTGERSRRQILSAKSDIPDYRFDVFDVIQNVPGASLAVAMGLTRTLRQASPPLPADTA